MNQPTQQDIESWLWESANILRGPVDPANLRDFVFPLLFLKRHQALNKARWVEDNDVLFPNSIGRLRDETLDKSWMSDLCMRAGTPHYTRYQLRKSCFTNFLRGADLGTTKAFSGHTSTKTLEDHYITPESSAVREAAKRAEAALLKEQDRFNKKII